MVVLQLGATAGVRGVFLAGVALSAIFTSGICLD